MWKIHAMNFEWRFIIGVLVFVLLCAVSNAAPKHGRTHRQHISRDFRSSRKCGYDVSAFGQSFKSQF